MLIAELKAKCLHVPWTTEICHLGEDCGWCLIVRPKERLFYNWSGDKTTHYDIIPDGQIDGRFAEYIVLLHNMNLQLKQKMKITSIVESEDDGSIVLLFFVNDLGMTRRTILRNTGINTVTLADMISKKIIVIP